MTHMKRLLFILLATTLTLACSAQGFTDARKFVKEMKRIPGNDSIYYKVNSRWYAIKDSIGSASGSGVDSVTLAGAELRIWANGDSIPVLINAVQRGTFISATGIIDGDTISFYGRELTDGTIYGTYITESDASLMYINPDGSNATVQVKDTILYVSYSNTDGSYSAVIATPTMAGMSHEQADGTKSFTGTNGIRASANYQNLDGTESYDYYNDTSAQVGYKNTATDRRQLFITPDYASLVSNDGVDSSKILVFPNLIQFTGSAIAMDDLPGSGTVMGIDGDGLLSRTTGGSGSPGGGEWNDFKSVQYFATGAFDGDSIFMYDPNTGNVFVGDIFGQTDGRYSVLSPNNLQVIDNDTSAFEVNDGGVSYNSFNGQSFYLDDVDGWRLGNNANNQYAYITAGANGSVLNIHNRDGIYIGDIENGDSGYRISVFHSIISYVDSNDVEYFAVDISSDEARVNTTQALFPNATTISMPAMLTVASTSLVQATQATDDAAGYGAVPSGSLYKNTNNIVFWKP